MTLASLLSATVAISTAPFKSYRNWREAVHASRNVATKAVAVARLAETASNKHYVAVAMTLPEEAWTPVDREFINRARGLR